MSAIIADDEQLAREELKFLLDQIGDVEVVADRKSTRLNSVTG